MAAGELSRWSGQLHVFVIEDRADLELSAERLDVPLEGGQPHVGFLLDPGDVRPGGAESVGHVGLAHAAEFAQPARGRRAASPVAIRSGLPLVEVLVVEAVGDRDVGLATADPVAGL